MTDRKETMRDIDHTHPFRDRPAGELFLRGPTVVADGGRKGETPSPMDDLDHASSESNVVHERGPDEDV